MYTGPGGSGDGNGEELRRAANAGDARAQAIVGAKLLEEDGEAAKAEGREWVERAARGGDARGAVAAGDACRMGAGGPRDLEAAVEYYEMAVSSENVAEAPGTRDRAVRGALEAIGEAAPGSGLKDHEAIWKERLGEVAPVGPPGGMPRRQFTKKRSVSAKDGGVPPAMCRLRAGTALHRTLLPGARCARHDRCEEGGHAGLPPLPPRRTSGGWPTKPGTGGTGARLRRRVTLAPMQDPNYKRLFSFPRSRGPPARLPPRRGPRRTRLLLPRQAPRRVRQRRTAPTPRRLRVAAAPVRAMAVPAGAAGVSSPPRSRGWRCASSPTSLLYQELVRSGALDARGRFAGGAAGGALHRGGAVASGGGGGGVDCAGGAGVGAYQPSQRYLAVDERHVGAEDLPVRNLMAAVVGLEQSRTPADLVQVAGRLVEWFAGPAWTRG